MNYQFYAMDVAQPLLAATQDTSLRWQYWRPRVGDVIPPGLAWIPFAAWSAMHFSRRFRNRNYAVMIAYDGGKPIHRTCVFPGYFRFPFMAADDLQIGDVWTDPQFRGQGIAKMGLQHTLRQIASLRQYPSHGSRRVWYLTESTNSASIRLAERIGFASIGQGTRTKRFRCRALGSYVMNKTCSESPHTRMESHEKAA